MLTFSLIAVGAVVALLAASFGHAIAMGMVKASCQRNIPLVCGDRVYVIADVTATFPPPPRPKSRLRVVRRAPEAKEATCPSAP